MDLEVADLTAAEEWEQSLNATCNRLSTQYLNLLKSASSITAMDTSQHDPRSGGGVMLAASDPPPPPLAADAALAAVQCQLAVENIGVASAHLLSLVRTLRLSLLLMDHDTIDAEQQVQIKIAQNVAQSSAHESVKLEQDIVQWQNQEIISLQEQLAQQSR